MNTTENNKLIAEFMGYAIIDLQGNHKDANYNYHTSWNWLMQVVEKINDYNNVVKIHENHVRVVNNERGEVLVDVVSGSMFEAVYNACVEFIKMYNEQK